MFHLFRITNQKIILLMLIGWHLNFYVSALITNHLQMFYPWGILHQNETRYLDYLQVPRGAQGLLRGESSSGVTVPSKHITNTNVYHPAFTSLVGTPLQFLTAEAGFWVISFNKVGFYGNYFCIAMATVL